MENLTLDDPALRTRMTSVTAQPDRLAGRGSIPLVSSPCDHARALHDGKPREQAVGVVLAADREQIVESPIAHVAAGERLESNLARDRPEEIPVEVRPECLAPPAVDLAHPHVHIRRDADQAEAARIEAELLVENAGAVREQRRSMAMR